MREVNPFTRDGQHQVTTLKLPQLSPLPEAIIWEERVYIRCIDIYREAFTYVVEKGDHS